MTSSLCTNAATQAGNFGETFGYAVANMFGIGGFIKSAAGGKANTALDNLNKQIASINEDTKAFAQAMNIRVIQNETKLDAGLLQGFQLGQKELYSQVQFNEEKMNDDISSNRIYIFASWALLLVMLIFLILS